MKRVLYGLGTALLVIFCTTRPKTLYAQEEKTLSKKVAVQANHEKLQDVLDDLSKKGYFTFSYQSDILQKDRLITLTIKESTLREALELILGKAYEYVESGDYVVIRRSDPVASKKMAAGAAKVAYVAKVAISNAKARPVVSKKYVSYAPDSLNTGDSLNISALRQTVRNIIDDLVADGIISNKENFKWFALDNGQFVVDGKNMPDSLRTKYAAKYVKPDGSGYYCGTLVGVTGRGYFFDKQEIFGRKKE